jgi:hypothetical protein
VFSFGQPHFDLLKPFRMLNEHLATIDYRQHHDQPDLDEEIQLLRHGASPSAVPSKSDTSRGDAIKLQVTELNSDLVAI